MGKSFQPFVETHLRRDGCLQAVVAGKRLYQFVMEAGYGVVLYVEADGIVFGGGVQDAFGGYLGVVARRSFRLLFLLEGKDEGGNEG